MERKGGFDQVCKGKRWAEVGRDLGYSGKIMSSLSTSLKNSYQKWLYPYEEYLRLAKPGVQQQLEMLNGGPYTPSPGPSPAKKSYSNTPMDVKEETPAMRASAALQSTIDEHSPLAPIRAPELATQPHDIPAPPLVSSGFTAVNSGGSFTAVNSGTPSTSFTSVNGTNGIHQPGALPTYNPMGTPPFSNGTPATTPHHNSVATLKRQHSDSILTPDEVDAMNRRSKRLRRDIPTIAGSNMHHSRMSAARLQAVKDRGGYRVGEICENCAKTEDSARFITCSTCECAYHMYCIDSPLTDYEWHCSKCLVGTNDYGFEEGDVYSLAGFQQRANEFKANHFNSLPAQFSPFSEHKNFLTEEDVEKEFWRLVEDINGTIEVEYGADIHSTTHGSAFPTIEKQPRDPYSADPWNLNILPLDKESLFRHIKSDISGMTVPWLYVGMLFSTFCWHNEDHYAYSANYQHFGQTKTWYGIPGEDAEKFEQAMREEVPELFETQPDLLFQLVTLAKPEKLRKAGARVYALDQHAGEFVITFPQAYHAGFNHGFNFNEAVNFAPPDWEPFGEAGVRRLRDYRKQPCFSHDELLITASSRELTIRTAKWLAPALERMRDEELAARRHFMETPIADSGTATEETYSGVRYEGLPDLIDTDTEEEEVICTYCKCFCYLSRYQCKKTSKWLCALHAGSFECCDALKAERYSGHDGTHRMAYRTTDEALKASVQKVVDKANVPEAWAAKIDTELDDNPRPQLKHLRTLLAEGDRIQYDLPQLADLRRFVERCNEWVEEATIYITRKQQNRRKSEKTWRGKGSVAAKAVEVEEREKELRKVENIQKLLAKADDISFECAEISTLRERAENISAFQNEADTALNNIRGKTTSDFEDLVERGREFHVDMPQIESLEQVVRRLRWDDRAKDMRPNITLKQQLNSLGDIEKFIAEGLSLGVPENNHDLLFFREHKAQGDLWEHKAKELMSAEHVHYQQLDSLSQQAMTLAVNPETLAAVDAILKKQREVQDKIASMLERSKNPQLSERPKYKEMKDVLKSLEELQSKPSGTIDLEKEQKKHEDWMRRGKKLFGKANAPLHILSQHMDIVRARNEACFDVSDKPRMPVEPSSRHATPDENAPISDGSNSSRDVFCICRRPEAGMMIECELCHEWYHGKCLKIARGKVKEDEKYTCPICDWRLKIPRDAARPKLEELQNWHSEMDNMPFQPEEEDALEAILNDAQQYRDFIKPIVHSDVPTTPEEIDTLRFHLRKVEGADILLAEETNFLRQELHKWAPVGPEAPPVIQYSSSTRKPRPTKQQKLMAQLGITDPEDLPQEYKIKYHIGKKKDGDPAAASQPPLQPAASYGSRPPSAAPSPAGRIPPEKQRSNLTALSIHILGRLASAPVVSQMLSVEPHMNRDKLSKMKAVLLSDRALWDDLDGFKAKLNTMPTPTAHSPAFTYDTGQDHSIPATSSHRESPYYHTASSDARSSLASRQPRLASPARFGTTHAYTSNATPPTANVYDPSLFTTEHDNMFESPANESKPTETSPDFGAHHTDMFDSPKPGGLTHGGTNSPGYSGSQQSANGHMENVFADLVHDHDGAGGLDGTQENVGEAGVAVSTNDAAPSTEHELKIDPQMRDMEMTDSGTTQTGQANATTVGTEFHEDPLGS